MLFYPTQPRRPARSKSRIIPHHANKGTSFATSTLALNPSNAESSTAPSHPPSPTAAQHHTWAPKRTAQSMPSSPQANHQPRCSNCPTERKHRPVKSNNCTTMSANRQKMCTSSQPSTRIPFSASPNSPQQDTSQSSMVKRSTSTTHPTQR